MNPIATFSQKSFVKKKTALFRSVIYGTLAWNDGLFVKWLSNLEWWVLLLLNLYTTFTQMKLVQGIAAHSCKQRVKKKAPECKVNNVH